MSGATSSPKVNVELSPCFTSIICEADLVGSCNITFKDTFNKTFHQASGELNNIIPLPKFQVNLNVSFTAVFNYTFFRNGNFTLTSKCNNEMTELFVFM